MTEYFNLIKPTTLVKTLILTSPEQCLNYNKIVIWKNKDIKYYHLSQVMKLLIHST